MLMIVLLVGILLTAFGVIGWLWFAFQKEADMAQDKGVVPVAAVVESKDTVMLEEQKIKIQQLQDQLKESQDKEKAADELVAQLKQKTDELKGRVNALESAAFSQNEETLAHLRAENVAFRQQVEETARQLRDLQEGTGRFESDQARMRLEFESMIERLREENRLLQEQASAPQVETQGFIKTVDELSGRVRELEVTQALLTEKNEYLQYELTKSRAQVVGLERLCEQSSTANAA